MAEHRCVTCAVYRPDADPRLPVTPPVCDGDRRRITWDLSNIPTMSARLAELVAMDRGRADGKPTTADPVAHRLPAGPTRGRSSQPTVSGGSRNSMPISPNAVDLALPARQPEASDQARRWPDDHTGLMSTATLLDQWVRDWRDLLWPSHHLPVPTVPVLAEWLTNRVDTACDQHPALGDFAAEIAAHASALRSALGETKPRPVILDGVPCRNERCDQVGTLMRLPGDEWIECDVCGLLLSEAEYRDWVAREAGYERSLRTPDEVAELLRHRPPLAA